MKKPAKKRDVLLFGPFKYGYGTCVFRGRTGWKPAAWWWSKRRPTTFGQTHRTDAA